jgi:repressor LexA
MLGEKIKFLRKSKKMSLEQLAEQIGTSRQTVHRYENGIITNIPHDKIEALARALGTTPAKLMGWESEEKNSSINNITELRDAHGVKTKKLPILGNVACGEPIFASEEYDYYATVGADIAADFCLTAKGDSMINARIHDGDIVFIKEMPMVDNGEIAAVIIDDEATLKRVYYYPEKNKLVLQAENPKYEPWVYVNEELNEIRILGKAVYFMSNL